MIIPKKINKFDLYYNVYSILNITQKWNLTKRDISVFSALLNTAFKYYKEINDYNLLMLLVFKDEVKKDIRKDLNISYNSFMNALTKLRKRGLIISKNNHNYIEPSYILNISKTDFKLTIQYSLNG